MEFCGYLEGVAGIVLTFPVVIFLIQLTFTLELHIMPCSVTPYIFVYSFLFDQIYPWNKL